MLTASQVQVISSTLAPAVFLKQTSTHSFYLIMPSSVHSNDHDQSMVDAEPVNETEMQEEQAPEDAEEEFQETELDKQRITVVWLRHSMR